jgi:hypothetical protein
MDYSLSLVPLRRVFALRTHSHNQDVICLTHCVVDNSDKAAFGDVMDPKPRFYAAMNGCMYATSIDAIDCPKCKNVIITSPVNNCAEMSPVTVANDIIELQDRVRVYLRKLDGLRLTISISDMARDLNMTEDAVIKIVEGWQIELDEDEYLDG